MDLVSEWEQIPTFTCEHDEAQYWLTHRLAPTLMNQSITKTNQTESTTITLRMDPRMLARIKRLARSRYLNYQSMIKQWISERLEVDLRGRSER